MRRKLRYSYHCKSNWDAKRRGDRSIMAMVRYDQDEIDDGYSNDGKDATKTYRAHGRPVACGLRGGGAYQGAEKGKTQSARGRRER